MEYGFPVTFMAGLHFAVNTFFFSDTSKICVNKPFLALSMALLEKKLSLVLMVLKPTDTFISDIVLKLNTIVNTMNTV